MMAALRCAALALLLRTMLVPAASLVAKQPSKIKSDSSPIAKVVTLITEMKATVEKEAGDDDESNDKYVCWCETNEKEKVAAIKSGKETVAELESFVQEAAGTSAKLATEIKGLESDIKEDQEALASANEQREKESEEFQASEADMKETIELLTQAVKKLGDVQLLQKHGKQVPDEDEDDALLQVKKVAKHVQGRSDINKVLQRDLFDVLGELDQVARREVKKQGSSVAAGALLSEVFLPKRNAPSLLEDFLKAPPSKPNDLKGGAQAKSYNSRSGPILGILVEMKDQFMRDLAKAQKEDFTALVNFHKLEAAKDSEIAAATKQKEMKEGELAALKSKVANSKETIEDTQEAIDGDEKFLATVRKNCQANEEDYNARVKARSEEIKALGETLDILTGDAARELFGKTVNVDFFQVATSTRARQRLQDRAAKRAMQKLMRVGRKNGNMGLALVSMAVRVRLDAFTKVKAAMDKMSAQLGRQKKQEYEKWEECKKEIDETEDDIKVASEEQEDLGEKHQDLVNTLSSLKDSTDELKGQVSTMEVELKKAGEARKAENMLFQTSISDQRTTVKILNMALSKLKAYYSSFVQTRSADEQPETKEYSKNANGGGVMQLIARIIADAESEEAVLAVSEKNAQKNYAEFVQDTTASIETARKAIAANEKQAASAEAEKSETSEAQLAKKSELEKLNKLLMGTHASCDYLIKNFDARQKAIGEEMDAIGEAKAILSGADFGK